MSAPRLAAARRAAERGHVAYIDGLRGFAILMVLAVHSALYVRGTFAIEEVGRQVQAGARGVTLFFLVSAYTLYSSSLVRFREDRSPVTSFYIRRAFRILPFFWIVATVFFAIGRSMELPWDRIFADGGHASGANFAAHLTFLFGFKPGWVNSLVPGGWTLFCEETFYLFLPLVFLAVDRPSRAWTLLAATTALAGVWLEYAPHFLKPDLVPLFAPAQWFNFAGGIVLYFVLRERPFEKIGDAGSAALDVAVAILVLRFLPGSLLEGSVACAALFMVTANERSIFHKLATTALMRRFGICCYSIYLFHFLVLQFGARFVDRAIDVWGLAAAPREIRFAIFFVAAAAACLALGTAGFQLIEYPFISLGKRVIARWNGEETAAATASETELEPEN
jgi:peptidoglycan/LPS O-acetylase OafA/YrhL